MQQAFYFYNQTLNDHFQNSLFTHRKCLKTPTPPVYCVGYCSVNKRSLSLEMKVESSSCQKFRRDQQRGMCSVNTTRLTPVQVQTLIYNISVHRINKLICKTVFIGEEEHSLILFYASHCPHEDLVRQRREGKTVSVSITDLIFLSCRADTRHI